MENGGPPWRAAVGCYRLLDGLLVAPLVDGDEEPLPLEPPDPLPPMFGQLWVLPVGALPFGWVVPPPPVDGWVVAFGAGDPDGSAARTTAVPPTTSRPTASAAVAIPRRMPPNDDAGPGVDPASGTGGTGGG